MRQASLPNDRDVLVVKEATDEPPGEQGDITIVARSGSILEPFVVYQIENCERLQPTIVGCRSLQLRP